MATRVAVVLAGCGVFDGSEIHEASAVLVHLSRGGASVSFKLVVSIFIHTLTVCFTAYCCTAMAA